MPGKESYGSGGKWIHDRAHRVMKKGYALDKYGPEKGKRMAYAIATQQAHKLEKTPYGASKGKRETLSKFRVHRKDMQKAADINPYTPEVRPR